MRKSGVVPLLMLVAVALPGPNAVADAPAWSPDESWAIRDEAWVDGSGTVHATVDAFLAYPDDVAGTDTLVVMAHGYTHNATGSWWPHMEQVVAHGAAALAMDFRDNNGFPVLRGAQDMNDATAEALDRLEAAGFEIDRVIAFGVSMGGAVSGTAVAEAPGLYDLWFNVEGVTVLYETWAEASAALPAAAAAIERDTGCSFAVCPQEFLRRSPAHRAGDMVDGGLTAAYTIHAAYDGLVPYDQGAQMAVAAAAAGLPHQLVTVLRGEEGTDQDTTPGSHALGKENEVEALHGLSGHGTESDASQAVMATAFDLLWDVLDGQAPPSSGLELAIADRDLA
ncbi:MAG: alpha/beta hydrolase family protein [Thermoplasmatota archaeon]